MCLSISPPRPSKNRSLKPESRSAGTVSALRLSALFLLITIVVFGVAEPTAADTPALPLDVYWRLIDQCAPPWDPADTNVVTQTGDQLGYQPDAVQIVFVSVWGDLAWQRWRWEADCLAVALTQADSTPQPSPVPTTSPAQTPVPTTSPADTTIPSEHADYTLIYIVALARGADEAVARQVAARVVANGSVVDFLAGAHSQVVYGLHPCTARSDACPLAPDYVPTAPPESHGAPPESRRAAPPTGGGILPTQIPTPTVSPPSVTNLSFPSAELAKQCREHGSPVYLLQVIDGQGHVVGYEIQDRDGDQLVHRGAGERSGKGFSAESEGGRLRSYTYRC